AVSRVANGLAPIVDPECETVWIGTYQRKSMSLPFFPQYRHFSGLWLTAGVDVSRFCKSYHFSAVVNGTGLPIIAADRGESTHVAVSPKKRNTDKVRAEAANVFAVRICISCFGHADGFPAVVEAAPVDPTVGVGFSKRA